MELKLEINENALPDQKPVDLEGGKQVLVCPPLDEDYWLYRVPVTEDQALVAFPKFGTIGIGFQKEEVDWNLNLPAVEDAAVIYGHIISNKGPKPCRADCINAIKMLQAVVKEHMGND